MGTDSLLVSHVFMWGLFTNYVSLVSLMLNKLCSQVIYFSVAMDTVDW